MKVGRKLTSIVFVCLLAMTSVFAENVIERELEVTAKNLLLPITNGKGGGHLTVKVDGELVHNLKCTFAPNKDAVHWWGYLDMSEYKGKTAKLSITASEEIANMIKFGKELPNIQPLYNEKLRPQFHISQMRGWNNDPNGMVYYDGEYHFFWQSNPAGRGWANMYWGHVVSKDLVHWKELPHALRNGGGGEKNRHPSMAANNCFSGSANVDYKNTAGWKSGKEDVVVLAFTDTGCGEALAYSTDRGRTYKYYEGNPVIRHRGRDPKLIWYEYKKDDTPLNDEAKKLNGHWVIAVYDEKGGKNVAIYTSTNLKEWELQSHLYGYFECAELFELPVDGDPSSSKDSAAAGKKNTRWVVFAADARYAVGEFDGKKFTPEHEKKYQVHYGPYYASQCFSGDPKGRVIQVGWARIDMKGMPFNQTFTVPTTLTLKDTPNGVRMYANPVEELEKLRKKDRAKIKNEELTADKPSVECEVKSDLADIVLKVKKGTASKVTLSVGGLKATYDFAEQKLNGKPAPMEDDVASMRLLIDRSIRELIGGNGAFFETIKGGSSSEPIGKVSVKAEGGTATIKSLNAYEMKSAWKK